MVMARAIDEGEGERWRAVDVVGTQIERLGKRDSNGKQGERPRVQVTI